MTLNALVDRRSAAQSAISAGCEYTYDVAYTDQQAHRDAGCRCSIRWGAAGCLPPLTSATGPRAALGVVRTTLVGMCGVSR